MTTQPDIIWNEQCLGIRIGEQVCTYLKKHDAEYQRLQKKILELTEKYPVIETFMETNQSISLTEEEHKAVHRYFQLESEKEMIEEEYHFYMGQAQMISYGAMLGKIKKAILGNDEGNTKKLLELLMDTWIDEVEDQLKENTVYQGMLEKISKYEEQVQTMGLSKEKRKTIPVLVLIKQPSAISESEKDTGNDKYDKMKKLDEFREKVKNDKNTVDFFTDLNSLKYVASPTFRNAVNYVDDNAGWVRYRDIVDIINEEAEGRNKANTELGEHQQKMLDDMKEMFSQFYSRLTDLENNQFCNNCVWCR